MGFQDFQVFFSRPKLAQNISIICSGQGSFFDDATFFFQWQELGEKKSEPTTSDP